VRSTKGSAAIGKDYQRQLAKYDTELQLHPEQWKPSFFDDGERVKYLLFVPLIVLIFPLAVGITIFFMIRNY
jgi:hypothetical protein